MSQYSASSLNVDVNYNGTNVPCEINNIVWNNNNFTGTVDSISVQGTDNNGFATASGSYFGMSYTESGTVTGWN